MATINSTRIATIVFLIFACSVASAQSCQPLKPDYYGSYKFEFPADLAGIRRERVSRDNDPQVGSKARYVGQGIVLNISIANDGVSGIPDGIESAELQNKFEEMKANLKSGDYDRVLLQSERRRAIGSGDIPVVEAMHTLEVRGTKTMSFIYLGAKYKNFISIDLTLAASRWGDASKISDGILATVVDVFCQNAPFASQSGGAGPNLSVSPIDRANVLAAIDRLLRAQSVADATREMQLIRSFAKTATGVVQIVVNETFFETSGNDYADQFLMTYYVAGAIKHDLENPEDALNPRADIVSSIRAMVAGYKVFTIENAYFIHPFVDGFANMDVSGELEAYVHSLQ